MAGTGRAVIPARRHERRAREKRRETGTMTRAARWAIALVLLFVLASFATLLIAAWSLGSGISFHHGNVLAVRLDRPVVETAPRDRLSRLLGEETLVLRDLVAAIDAAREDDRIDGLYLEVDDTSLGWAQGEELRAAITRFRKSGKWTVAWAETFGEMGGGTGAYWLASACREVYLAPPGDVGLTGLRVETPFIRGLLDKLGIVPQFGQRKEYKNAVNTYTETDYTRPHREALEALLDVLYGELVDGIAAGRELTPERVRELIDGGPWTGDEAKEHGLVDDLLYRDQLMDLLEKKAGRDDPLEPVDRYLDRREPFSSGRKKLAVVYAVGAIQRGESGADPLYGRTMGSDTIVRALRKAREDDSVDAVVLRVDSPGGSYVASDLIRREVVRTAKEKPLLVSMGNYAASGGYFISMQGPSILADRTTITGSIGVFGGKFVTRDFWEKKLGIRFPGIQRGRHADLMSTQEPWDEEGWAKMNSLLDRIYDDFVTKAAKGRGMTYDELEPLAHGRVWAGKDAHARKLVDEIGGLREALDRACVEAGGEPGEGYRVEVLPRPKSFLERLLSRDRDEVLLGPEGRRALALVRLLTRPAPEALLLDPDLPRVR